MTAFANELAMGWEKGEILKVIPMFLILQLKE